MKTKLSIIGDKFLINGELTYSEIPTSKEEARGLLMNARFIQGIFDDKNQPERYIRFGYETWDPDENTQKLIQALPEWYQYGLRAFTVGFQGGGPCFTIPNEEIHNSPFSNDGMSIEPIALERMKRIIVAADELGMVVIVSCFYSGQIRHFDNNEAVIAATTLIARWLKKEAFTNVILEIANEMNCSDYIPYSCISTEEGLCELMSIAREESGGVFVGCSSLGFSYYESIGEASDINIIHGNNITRQHLYKKILRAKEVGVPILCNEDSQALSRLGVTFPAQVSWGYYNNLTKQEPPTDWSVLKGEDLFFAYRMAEGIGIEIPKLEKEDLYYLQGFEKNITYQGKRWIRLASMYPETIDYVEFYCNEVLTYIVYDDPFLLNYEKTWDQKGVDCVVGDQWKAVIHLVSGEIITKNETVV